MSYKSRFGVTKLKKDRYSSLSVHWDYDDDPEDIKQRFAMLTFIPDMNEPDHEHIIFTDREAWILYQWLGEYLKEKRYPKLKGTTPRSKASGKRNPKKRRSL